MQHKKADKAKISLVYFCFCLSLKTPFFRFYYVWMGRKIRECQSKLDKQRTKIGAPCIRNCTFSWSFCNHTVLLSYQQYLRYISHVSKMMCLLIDTSETQEKQLFHNNMYLGNTQCIVATCTSLVLIYYLVYLYGSLQTT